MGEVILEMKGIDKSFPGVHALDHVDLEIRKGEVLALMGEWCRKINSDESSHRYLYKRFRNNYI